MDKNIIEKYLLVLKTGWRLGLRHVGYIIWYRFTLKTGLRKKWFKGKKYQGCEELNPNFRAGTITIEYDHTTLLNQAENLIAGRLHYFSWQEGQVGNPPNWFKNPFNGQEVTDPGKHWCDIIEADIAGGDIKYIWEPSRFTWAPVLARAYRVSGDRKYLKVLHGWIVSWLKQNPVNSGPNWRCGQECSIRLMNLLLALHILESHSVEGSASSKTEFPWSRDFILFFVQEHVKRISGNIRQAVAQQNNHATSEAAGLYIGGLFLAKYFNSSELCGRGRKFSEVGRRWLEKLVRELIYEDGSFSQHSLTYHRVLLDTLSMVSFWNKKTGDKPFSSEFYHKYNKALDWMFYMTDDLGDGPNLGANDGALFFWLTDCSYRDFRPCMELARYILEDKCFFDRGEWHEGIYWLFGDMSPSIEAKERTSIELTKGGYVRLQGENTWGLVRYPNYRNHRPSHADALHFDMWLKGRNVLLDGGSYSYACEPPWDHYFKSTEAHNTILVDGQDQMPLLSRFLFGDWTRGRVVQPLKKVEKGWVWSGEHYGYKQCSHRRQVELSNETWIISDSLKLNYKKECQLIFRLSKSDWKLKRVSANETFCLEDEIKIKVTSNNDFQASLSEGCNSLYYGKKTSLPVLICKAYGKDLTFITEILPA